MFLGNYRSPYSSVGTILKVLIGVAILVITVALILVFTNALNSIAPLWELKLAVAGAVILVFAFLSLKIFEGLN